MFCISLSACYFRLVSFVQDFASSLVSDTVSLVFVGSVTATGAAVLLAMATVNVSEGIPFVAVMVDSGYETRDH